MKKKNMGIFLYKKTMCLLMSFLLIFSLTGCSAKEAEVKQEKENDRIQIGFSFDSLVIERWTRDRDVFVARARELGADVNVQNANGDVKTQISQIEYFVKKNVDAIVIVAADCASLSDVVAKAKKAGIKVISYDRLISNANTDLYISFDNYQVGTFMGEAIISQIGYHGDILMINGSPTDTNVPSVMEGFHQAISSTNIRVVETDYCDNWKAEYAFDYVSNYLNTHQNKPPVAIMCGNDSLAGQVIKALSERKLAGSIVVTGQDADLDACQRIVEGTQYMTVYKPVEKLAQRAAERTVELVKNGKINVEDTMNDGIYDVPFERLEPVKVTAANMDEAIIGTFHQKSEVYLNVEPEE